MSRLSVFGSLVLAVVCCDLTSAFADGQDRASASRVQNSGLVGTLPISKLPAIIRQNLRSGTGILTMTIPGAALAVSVSTHFVNPLPATVGRVTRTSSGLLFMFSTLRYSVNPIVLPTGQQIDRETLALDPAYVSKLRVNLQTGAISRDFHWRLTATNALFNGSRSIGLAEHGKSSVLQVHSLGGNRYGVTIRTQWKNTLRLRTFRVNQKAEPTGLVDAHVTFTGTYIIDFNK